MGRTETYQYDYNGNVLRFTDRKGQVPNYTYDKFGRPTRIDYGDGSYTENTYDAVGRLTRIYDSVSGSIEYEYSNAGCTTGCSGGAIDRVIRETTSLGSISYSYDALGRRTSMTLAGQPTVNYQYDPSSHLTEIVSLINGVAAGFSLRYDGLGRRISLAYPNGVTTNYTYDNASNLLDLKHLNALNQIFESINYTYDANGNRTNMQRANVPAKLPDPKSNITFNSANQMLTFNDKSMTYDDNGNMTSITNSCGTTTYTWDVCNRLVGISGLSDDCSPLTASLKYDAFGRRIEKTINGRTIQYFYDGADIVQQVEGGVATANYLRTFNIDEPIARLTPGSSRFYQLDALGSVVVLTDEGGIVKTQYIYDPFGNVAISGEASDNAFQYTGRENDGTGLYYYRARYYSPELQRFVSGDPIGFAGGLNFYAYVQGNPVNRVDPEGLDVWFVQVGGGAFIGEPLFWRKGWLSQVYFGLAFDTTTQRFILYKSSAATWPSSVDTVMGLGFGPGATGGWVKDNMNDFLGKSREQTYSLVGSYSETVTCSGRPGHSFGISKGISVGYTDVTTNTRVILDFNELNNKYDKWLNETSAKINNWLNKVLTPRWY